MHGRQTRGRRGDRSPSRFDGWGTPYQMSPPRFVKELCCGSISFALALCTCICTPISRFLYKLQKFLRAPRAFISLLNLSKNVCNVFNIIPTLYDPNDVDCPCASDYGGAQHSRVQSRRNCFLPPLPSKSCLMKTESCFCLSDDQTRGVMLGTWFFFLFLSFFFVERGLNPDKEPRGTFSGQRNLKCTKGATRI